MFLLLPINQNCYSEWNVQIYKEDGGIRLRKCLFGLVVKCNLKFNFFILNLFDILLIQFCKSTISNYILTNDIKKILHALNPGGIEPTTLAS